MIYCNKDNVDDDDDDDDDDDIRWSPLSSDTVVWGE